MADSPLDPMAAALSPLADTAAWSAEDDAALAAAAFALERSSFAQKISGLLGRQIGLVGDFIPEDVARLANRAAFGALSYAARGALATLSTGARPTSPRWHMAAVAASGAMGGAFGLATLPIELPVSTTLMLRAIASVARQEGEDLADPATALACIEVFALGAGTKAAPLGQSSYFAARMVMAKSVSEATRFMLQRSLAEDAAPVLLRLIGQVASRFGLVVAQKAILQSLPIIGAVTGAAINATFMEHYQAIARGHFTIRRLERRHGADAVRAAYERLRAVQHATVDGAHADLDASLGRTGSEPATPSHSAIA